MDDNRDYMIALRQRLAEIAAQDVDEDADLDEADDSPAPVLRLRRRALP